jgi:tRNA threonylcarbamoyladenosine biosynthesis protein TsaE
VPSATLPTLHGQLAETWHDEDDTRRRAEQLAQALQGLVPAGDAVIELSGTLGAGKTTFVRHLLRALGATGRIKSPSYAIVEPYELPGLSAWHFDFYRFSDPREWEDAGFRELFASAGLKLVEWPDKVRTMLPVPDLQVAIGLRLDGPRDVCLSAGTARGAGLLTSGSPQT